VLGQPRLPGWHHQRGGRKSHCRSSETFALVLGKQQHVQRSILSFVLMSVPQDQVMEQLACGDCVLLNKIDTGTSLYPPDNKRGRAHLLHSGSESGSSFARWHQAGEPAGKNLHYAAKWCGLASSHRHTASAQSFVLSTRGTDSLLAGRWRRRMPRPVWELVRM